MKTIILEVKIPDDETIDTILIKNSEGNLHGINDESFTIKGLCETCDTKCVNQRVESIRADAVRRKIKYCSGYSRLS